ncbi:MAG: M48 family metalloprotease [Phycisphaerae bacterium]
MAGLFWNLGHVVGNNLRKGRWLFQAATGTQADAIRAEYDWGRQLARDLERQMRPSRDAVVLRRVTSLGTRLAGRLTNRHRRFSFRVVYSDQVNAFALPGGFVFVTQPLLERCAADEPALAFVLGHEMGHVVRGHVMERMAGEAVMRVASARLPGGLVSTLLTRFVTTAYSRDHEIEADIFAVRLLCSAGLDAQGAIRTLRMLEALSSGDASLLPPYLQTHPPAQERIAEVAAWLKRNGR